MNPNANDLSFPMDPQWTPNNSIQCGLTKRELFAAMALQGALANPSRSGTPAQYAEFARMCAGALCSELSK